MDTLLEFLVSWARWSAATRRDVAESRLAIAGSQTDQTSGLVASVESGVSCCPDDGTTLVPALEPFETILLCSTCQGCFVPSPLDRAIVEAPEAFENMTVPDSPRVPDTVRYRVCPCCGQGMARRNFLRVSGIIVDCCPEHGTWFDAGELRAAINFVKDGGMARSQAHEEREAQRKRRHKDRLRAWGGSSPDDGSRERLPDIADITTWFSDL